MVDSECHFWRQTWARNWSWFNCSSNQARCHPRAAYRSAWKCRCFGNCHLAKTANLSRGGSQGLYPSPIPLALGFLRCSSKRCRWLRKVVHTLTLLQADCLGFNLSSCYLRRVWSVHQPWNWVWFWGLWDSPGLCGRWQHWGTIYEDWTICIVV